MAIFWHFCKTVTFHKRKTKRNFLKGTKVRTLAHLVLAMGHSYLFCWRRTKPRSYWLYHFHVKSGHAHVLWTWPWVWIRKFDQSFFIKPQLWKAKCWKRKLKSNLKMISLHLMTLNLDFTDFSLFTYVFSLFRLEPCY